MAKAAIDNKRSAGVAPLLIGVWALALVAAFLAYRGNDVGELQNLVGNLGGGQWFGMDGFDESLAGILIAVSIGISWFGIGNLAASHIDKPSDIDRSTILIFVRDTAIGAAIWSLIWFFLGLAGAYTRPVAIGALAVGVATGALGFRRILTGRRSDESGAFSGIEKLILVLIAVPLVLALIGSLSPPTAKDTLLYHFALPKAFVAQARLLFVDNNIASFLALGSEMHNVWAMLLGGSISARGADAAAGATVFLFFPLLLLAIFGWVRELGLEKGWRLIAVLIVATVPTAYHVAASAYIDLALALFVTLAVYELGRWWKLQERPDLIFLAIFLGTSLSIKLTAVFVLAAVALIVLLRARSAKEMGGNAGKVVLTGIGALLLAGVIASPWYLRTWKATGSPVFPFYMSIWKGEAAGWDVERSILFQAMNAQYGGADKSAVDYILSPLKLSVTSQPEEAAHFDGVLGVAFLIGLPILIWGLWKFETPIEVKIGGGVAGIMFLFWLFSSEQLRYLLPILPVLAIGIVCAGREVTEKIGGVGRVLQISLGAAAFAGFLVSAAWFLQKAPLRVVLGGESRDGYLTRNLDYYPYYQWLNTNTDADAKVWLINMRRDTYNLDRPVMSDYLFEDWTLRKMIWDAESVQELKARVAATGVKYVLSRHDFLFDYDRSTIVDDKKPRAENEAKLKMAKDLILDPANTIKSDDRFSLIKVFN
ncbi:MAG: hypothetical protein ABI999_07175 [Acidobacteriota bacterium]